jgi:hypothetical protein
MHRNKLHRLRSPVRRDRPRYVRERFPLPIRARKAFRPIVQGRSILYNTSPTVGESAPGDAFALAFRTVTPIPLKRADG